MESHATLSVALGVVAVLLFLCYWWPQRRFWALGGKIPGPPGYPLIGNALLFKGELTDNLPALMKCFQDYGRVVRLSLGPVLYVLLSDPDDIQVVLGDPKIRNRDWKISKTVAPFYGNGLVSLNGERWRLHRKLITPTFHFKILESFVEIFGMKSKILMEKLEELEGAAFDVYKVLTLCTLDSICETAIGTAINSQAVGHNDFVDCIHGGDEFIQRRLLRPWQLVDFIYHLSSDARRAKLLIETAHAFSETVIAQKLDEYRRGIRSPGITTAGNKRISSFLDMLIEASETQGSILSPEEMRDEVTTMAAAGLETTASTMSFLLVLIAIHPEVQAELHRELDEVFGSDDRPATSQDMQRLPVMERCIKETLRLFPIISLLSREIDMDLHLPSGYILPAGSSVLIMSYATQRDKRFYYEPDRFWPDRWLPEHLKSTHPYAYLPFGAGSRNCVGQKYAQLQMKSILCQVLRRYRVSTRLSMDVLQRLELSMVINLEQSVKERYCIQLHRRANK